ncbi:hypothetical protein NPIL_299511 [Nephila pilipes]|uniref:Uncharacterized protein n=1 Tax=Nephila pilipes TaxID=299642 RepID=A0A8X6MUB5_NEPPI|nr:hypothetical protein NPIL_299511 [Nephila pilipes]
MDTLMTTTSMTDSMIMNIMIITSRNKLIEKVQRLLSTTDGKTKNFLLKIRIFSELYFPYCSKMCSIFIYMLLMNFFALPQ